MTINYALMAKLHPKQKAALTRALHITDPAKRRAAVITACRTAMAEWDTVGAWPDDWSRWQRALDDQFRTFHSPDLRNLEGYESTTQAIAALRTADEY